jgi:hypothetical protein
MTFLKMTGSVQPLCSLPRCPPLGLIQASLGTSPVLSSRSISVDRSEPHPCLRHDLRDRQSQPSVAASPSNSLRFARMPKASSLSPAISRCRIGMNSEAMPLPATPSSAPVRQSAVLTIFGKQKWPLFFDHPRWVGWRRCTRGCSMEAFPFRQSLRQLPSV